MENSTDKATILIVDDEPMSVRILSFLLENEYNIVVAQGGKEALEVVSHITPDLILLDVLMPDLDGYGVFKALRISPVHKDTPVLFITVLGESECESQGLEMGASDYIIKPFNPDLVRLRIKNHLLFSQQRKMLAKRNTELEVLNMKLTAEIELRTSIQESNEQLIKELREAVANIKTLHGLIPICASCKKIRDDEGYWNQISDYLSKHTDLVFTHSICTECAQKLYPGIEVTSRQNPI